MLNLYGDGIARTCDGISRRDFLQVGALGAVGLSLADLLALESAQRASGDAHDDKRSCIMIFNLGAPSQIDTFDPKPDAPKEIRGPFKPIKTKSPDIQITDLFPLHAQHADKFSLVRSVYHNATAVHDSGHQLLQTGRFFTGGINTPHAGCALNFLKGRRGVLPAHVLLPEPMGPTGGNMPHGQDAGFLGKGYDPFVLNADPSKPDFEVPDLLPPQEIGDVRVERRRRLRDIVEGKVASFESSQNARLMDTNFQSAFRLMTSKQAREAFDLSRESEKTRERYGDNRFGMCCLLARRLIEAGVRFVTVNTFITVFGELTWDIHGSKPFTSIETMRDLLAPMYDKAYSALLEDLDQRSLLDDTLVACLSEFGRTPRINPAGGRDHWPQCWTVYFAGGGVQGGRVVGRSDENGGYPAERATEPSEVVATIFHSLGLPLTTTLPGPQSRPFPLVDYGVHEIKELF